MLSLDTEWLTAIAAACAVGATADRVLHRVLHGRYVTREEFMALDKTLRSEQLILSRESSRAHNRMDVMNESFKDLPRKLEAMAAQMVDLSRCLAVATARLEGVQEDIHEIRDAVKDRPNDRLND